MASIWDYMSPQSAINDPGAVWGGYAQNGIGQAISKMSGTYGNAILDLPGQTALTPAVAADTKSGMLAYWPASMGPAPSFYASQPDRVGPGVKIQTPQEEQQFAQQHGGVPMQAYQPNTSQAVQQQLQQQVASAQPNAYQQQFQQQQGWPMGGQQPQQQSYFDQHWGGQQGPGQFNQQQFVNTLAQMPTQSPWGQQPTSYQTSPGGYQWSQMPGMPYQNWGGGGGQQQSGYFNTNPNPWSGVSNQQQTQMLASAWDGSMRPAQNNQPYQNFAQQNPNWTSVPGQVSQQVQQNPWTLPSWAGNQPSSTPAGGQGQYTRPAQRPQTPNTKGLYYNY